MAYCGTKYGYGNSVDVSVDPGCVFFVDKPPTTTTTRTTTMKMTTRPPVVVPMTTTMKMTVPGLVTTTAKAELTTTTTTTTVAPSDCPFSATENDSPCHHTMCAVDTTSTECIDIISKW